MDEAAKERWRVERVLYLKGDFAVFKGRDEQGQEAVLVGRVPPPAVGTWLWVKTQEVEHPKYGKRRSIVRFYGLAPPPEAQAVPWGVWSRAGFGEEAARWLYAHYGKGTTRVYDQPQVVLVPGVPSEVLRRFFPQHADLLTVIMRHLAEGHTAPPLALIGHRLGLDQKTLEAMVDGAVRDGVLIRHKGRVGLLYYYQLEQTILRQVSFRVRGRGRTYVPARDLELSTEQRELFRALETARMVVLTGGPGTGKTTTSAALLKGPTTRQFRVFLAAPTGKAARRIAEVSGLEAQTIHRLIGIGESGKPYHGVNNPLMADLVVIDESSMIDVELMARLLNGISPRSQLLFVGDADQLPPVGPGKPFGDLSRRVRTVRLTKIYRQAAENPIVAGAYAVRNGRVPVADGDRLRLLAVTSEAQALAALLEAVRRADRPPQVLSAGNTGPLGTRALNVRLQHELNPRAPVLGVIGWRQEVREGDPVVWTVNDYELGLVNGETGVAYSVGGDLVLDSGYSRVTIPPERRSRLRLAYALTVHRSQGSEWPEVVTVLDRAHRKLLSRELLYTALTRSKERHTLIYDPEALVAARGTQAGARFTWLDVL